MRGVAAAGLLYSYPFVAHTGVGSHVIEPTAQIIVRQNKVDQRRLPDEDAKSLVFDDTLLFDIDKFSGYDRFETGTRANVGVQYTFQANNGVYARAVFGQSYPSRGRQPLRRSGPRSDREVQLLPGQRPRDQPLRLRGRPLSVAVHRREPRSRRRRFDEKDWSLRRQDTVAARPATAPSSASVAYTFAHFDPDHPACIDKQQEILGTPRPEADHQLERRRARCATTSTPRSASRTARRSSTRDECFVLTASYTETFVENAALDLKPDRTVMLRFELKHLGEFNYKTDQLEPRLRRPEPGARSCERALTGKGFRPAHPPSIPTG